MYSERLPLVRQLPPPGRALGTFADDVLGFLSSRLSADYPKQVVKPLVGKAKEVQTRREEIKQRTPELRRQQHGPVLLQGVGVS